MAPKEAELVKRAILKVCPPEDSKLCLPCKSSCLKLEHIALVFAIIISYGFADLIGIRTAPSV